MSCFLCVVCLRSVPLSALFCCSVRRPVILICFAARQELGATAGDTLECDFYCDFFALGMSEQMASSCASDAECLDIGLSSYEMRAGNRTICDATARYALYSSCVFPQSEVQAFLDAVTELIGDAANPDACPEVRRIENLKADHNLV